VLRIRIRDPVLFDTWIRDPGWKKIQDHFSESIEQFFGLKILKFFNADLEPGSGIFLTGSRIRDGKIQIWYPGSGTNIPVL
jgi:hypothetical protein